MYDLEISLHRSGAGSPFRVAVGDASGAFDYVCRYLEGCWGMRLPAAVDEAAIARQLSIRGEYRCDDEWCLIVVKRASA